MFDGISSRLSETVLACTTTMNPLSDIVVISSTSSTTVLNTLIPPFGLTPFGGILFIVNNSGNPITAVTTGNIASTCSIPNKNMATFIWSQTLGKWLVDKTT